MRQFWPNSRRARRHLKLAALSALLLAVFFIGLRYTPELWVDVPKPKADSIKWRASMSFAYTAVLFLSVALMIGPYRVLTKRPLSANMLLRRDVAIWAGVWAIAHTAVGLFMHVDGLEFWDSFLYEVPSLENPLPLKLTRIGQANYLGLLQLSIIVLLLALSNNRALRKLGTTRWKNLQRLTYVALGAIILHAYFYHRVERRLWAFRWPVYAVFLLVIVVQGAGFLFYLWRQQKGKR